MFFLVDAPCTRYFHYVPRASDADHKLDAWGTSKNRAVSMTSTAIPRTIVHTRILIRISDYETRHSNKKLNLVLTK